MIVTYLALFIVGASFIGLLGVWLEASPGVSFRWLISTLEVLGFALLSLLTALFIVVVCPSS